jgi:hypothetical protein
MSCGCGKPNEEHKPGDITLEKLQKAASNANIDIEQAADNIHAAAKKERDTGARR